MNEVTDKITDVSVIIRGVNERTQDACLYLLSREVPEKNIHLLNDNISFQKKLKQSFEIGLDSKTNWTLCVDADVLVRKNYLKLLLEEVKNISENVFEIHSKMLDKFSGGIRPGGVKLYRTKYFEIAKDLIPLEKESFRPETFVLKEMDKKGYPWIPTKIVIGIHDYEQYYKDIYRHNITNTIRGAEFIEIWQKYWRKHENEDFDFKIALLGSLDAQKFKDQNTNILDAQKYYTDSLNKFLEGNGKKEKDILPKDAYTLEQIDLMIENFKPEKEYLEFMHLINSRYDSKGKPITGFKKFKNELMWKLFKR